MIKLRAIVDFIVVDRITSFAAVNRSGHYLDRLAVWNGGARLFQAACPLAADHRYHLMEVAE
jgi:hypothetical protein